MTKSGQKSVKIIYLFWNRHTLKCKEKHVIRVYEYQWSTISHLVDD